MLKLDKKFKIYDTTPCDAVASLMHARFISIDDLKRIGVDTATAGWDDAIEAVFATGFLKYSSVALHTAPVVHNNGFPPVNGGFPSISTATCFPASSKVAESIYYDVDDVDYPMTLVDIYTKFNTFGSIFVAICDYGSKGVLELSGFVYKDNTGLR